MEEKYYACYIVLFIFGNIKSQNCRCWTDGMHCFIWEKNIKEKQQIVMYYNNNLILYNNNTIRLAY